MKSSDSPSPSTPFQDFPKKRYIRLRKILPILIPLGVAGPALLIIMAVFLVAMDYLDDTAKTQMENVSQKAVKETTAFLDVAAYTNSINAALLAALPVDDTFLQHFAQITNEEMERYPYFSLIYMGDKDGNHWLHRRERDLSKRIRIVQRQDDSPRSKEVIQKALQAQQSTSQEKEALRQTLEPILQTAWYAMEPDGTLALQSRDPLKVYDPRLRPWYVGALSLETQHWTNVYTWEEKYQGTTERQIGITISNPIKKNGQIFGVAAIDIILKDISDFLHRLKVSANSQAFIFDSKGMAIALPNYDEVILANSNPESDGRRPMSQVSDVVIGAAFRALLQGKTTDNQENILFETAQERRFDVDGQPHFGYFFPFRPELGLNWIIGVTAPEDDFKGGIKYTLLWSLAVTLLVIVLSVLLGLWVSQFFTRPINHLILEIKRLNQLDLQDMDGPSTLFQEIAFLSFSYRKMRVRLRSIISDISQQTIMLDAHAQAFLETSQRMSQSVGTSREAIRKVRTNTDEVSASMSAAAGLTEIMDDKMKHVVREMETMSQNMDAIAAAAEVSNVNLSRVANASEQATFQINQVGESVAETSQSVLNTAMAMQHINQSLSIIRNQCNLAIQDAERGRQNAEVGSKIMVELADSVNKVQSIVNVIDDVAAQTNMLSLNATVEAASAGEAGKGFAVVAFEVKELARHTAQSTRNISDAIHEISNGTQQAVWSNKDILASLRNLNQANQEIMDAVGKQSDSTNDINRAMQTLSREAEELTNRMSVSTVGINDVTKTVNEIAKAIAEVTKQVMEASLGVGRMAPLVDETTSGTWDIFISVGEAAQSSINIANQMVTIDSAADNITALSSGVREHADELTVVSLLLKNMLADFRV